MEKKTDTAKSRGPSLGLESNSIELILHKEAFVRIKEGKVKSIEGARGAVIVEVKGDSIRLLAEKKEDGGSKYELTIRGEEGDSVRLIVAVRKE